MHNNSVALQANSAHANGHRSLLYLALGALGVVYGDIGTSPLYAFRESFHHTYGIEPGPENVLGILSLIFWSLILVISIWCHHPRHFRIVRRRGAGSCHSFL
jgi:KUP system potassium uptake protein